MNPTQKGATSIPFFQNQVETARTTSNKHCQRAEKKAQAMSFWMWLALKIVMRLHLHEHLHVHLRLPLRYNGDHIRICDCIWNHKCLKCECICQGTTWFCFLQKQAQQTNGAKRWPKRCCRSQFGKKKDRQWRVSNLGNEYLTFCFWFSSTKFQGRESRKHCSEWDVASRCVNIYLVKLPTATRRCL